MEIDGAVIFDVVNKNGRHRLLQAVAQEAPRRHSDRQHRSPQLPLSGEPRASRGVYIASTTTAMPIPTPMHVVATP
jgi:hypothetical protein